MTAPVSVIVPVYNGAGFLDEAVASIRAQSPAPEEIIVIDDGSSDGSAEVASSFGGEVLVIRHPENQGLSCALNSGLAVARGDFIAFLDVDDMWLPGKQACQLDLCRTHPDIDIVIGHTQRMALARDAPGDSRFVPWDEPLLAMCVGAALFRRRAFERVGDFDTSLTHSMDWDWYFRAREQNVPFKVHPEVVLQYRRHGENMTEGETGHHYVLQTLRQSLQRRRQQSGRHAESLPDLDER